MSIADRALAAHAANEEAARLRIEAEGVERKALALDTISRAAESLGLSIRPGDLVSEFPQGKVWTVTLPVDDDVDLRFKWEWLYGPQPGLKMTVQTSDQLYWDLPPGEEKKHPGGGVYGCHNLGGIHGKEIKTLADLGAAIERVRRARESWRKKHCFSGS